MYRDEITAIQNTINTYFEGIYQGDINHLKSAFHPEALLFGDINGDPYFRTLDQYLEGVKNRKSPKELGEAFKMKTLAIELLGQNAIAKLRMPMLGFNYFDILSFSKIEGKWLIVNKLFTHILI